MAVQRIGRYQITAEIGSGGFGRVYAAQDPAVGRVVAIKVMNAPGDVDMVRRFRAEARTVAMLGHKNIVTVHEFGEQDGAPYLVMEYLEGATLDSLIRQGTLSLLEKVDIMIEVAEGLSCAHRQGITHRDVKPANIMRLNDGAVKIMDFGIARIASGGGAARLTQTGFIVGTWSYMAPEQFNGTSDAQTDIFAFGVTFYELLTGRNPFQAADPAGIFSKITNSDPAPISSLIPGCPGDLDRLIEKTLAKNRGERYADLQDLIVDARPIVFELKRGEAVHIYSKASQLLNSGQLDQAQAAVRKTLDLDPTHTGARQLRTQIEKEFHKRDAVAKAGTLLEKAEKELSQRQYQEAAETLASVRQMLPGDSPLQTRLMRADAQIENARRMAKLLDSARDNLRRLDYNDALRAVAEALVIDPNNNTGKALMEEIRTGQAVREAQRRLQEEMGRIEEMLLTSETEQALAQARELERKNPGSPEVANLRRRVETQWAEESRRQRLAHGIDECKTLVRNQQFEEALNKANTLLADFPEAKELQGLAKLASDRAAAKKRGEQLARLKSEAQAYISRQEFDYGIRLLETGVQKLGEDAELIALLQKAIEGKEQFERQQQIDQTANDARQLRRQRKYDEALAALDRAQQRLGPQPELQTLAAEIYAERREQLVREVARRAQAALDQQNPDAAATGLRECLMRSGEDPELRRLLETAEARIRERERAQRAQAILESARELAAAKCFDDALGALDEGLRQLPGDASLTAERKNIAAAKEAVVREEARQREEAERRYAEAQRQRELEQRRQEEAQKRQEEAQKRQEEIRRQQEEAKRQQEEAKRQQEETRRQQEEAKRRQWEEAQRQQEINSFLSQAQSYRDRGDAAGATQIISAAVLKHPSAAPLHDFQKQLDQDIEEQQRKLALDKACDEARSLVKQGRFDDALRVVDAAGIRFPQSLPLTALRTEIEQERAKARRRNDIDQALAKTADLVQGSQLHPGLKLLEEALQSYPDSRELKDAVARLRTRIEEEDRKRELVSITGAIQQAIASQDWNRALSQATAASAKFSTEEIQRLKRQAEQGKQQKEIDEAEAGVVEAGKAGKLDLAAELATAARIRFPQEKRFEKLEGEIQEARAEQKVAEARKLVAAKKLDEAEKLARQALKRCPNLLSANDVLADIAARRQAIDQLKSREESRPSQPITPQPAATSRKNLVMVAAAIGVLIAGGIVWKLLQPSKKPVETVAGTTTRDVSKSIAQPSPDPAPSNPASANPESTNPPATTPAGIVVTPMLDSPTLEQGQEYNDFLHATGGTDLTWSLNGRLPRGLTLDKNGRIHGHTTDKATIYSFEAVATDAGGTSGSAHLDLTVTPAISGVVSVPAKGATASQEKKTGEAATQRQALPQPQTQAASCKPFDLAAYGDLPKSTFTWMGRLTNGQATINYSAVQRGNPPQTGIPIHFDVKSPAGVTVTGPDKSNCWTAPMVVHSPGDAPITVVIAWQVYQP